jgi:LytS/YehU family sensor histidine kinase
MKADTRKVALSVINSYFPKGKSDQSGSGIGLDNLIQRLNKMYPDNYYFSKEVIDDKHIIKIEINTI